MNWDAIGAVGEVFGALAVVTTLIYLSRQLREHTKSLHVQSINTTFSEFNDLLKEIQSLDGMGGGYKKMLANEALSPDEEWELNYLFRRIFNINDKMLYLHSIDAADSYNQATFERSLPPLLKTTFFANWWPEFKFRYSEEFQNYIEKIAESD